MRLIIARCQVTYRGRLSTVLPEAVRLLMLKGDGTFMVFSDGGGSSVKPLNWMTPPTAIEERRDPDGRLRGLTVGSRGRSALSSSWRRS
jgi:RecB family endonuclease NucS